MTSRSLKLNKALLAFGQISVLALILLGIYAHADVITLTGTTETAKPKASLVASDMVLWCESGGNLTPAAPRSSCAVTAQKWLRFDNMQSYSWTLTDGGWYRNESIPTVPVVPVPPTYVFTGYDCKPASPGEVRTAKKGEMKVKAWFCDLPTALKVNYFCWDARREPDGFWSLAWNLLPKPSRRCSADERALVYELQLAEGPRVVVAANGTSKDRPVYDKKADGMLGAANGKRVAVDVPTDPAKRSYCHWDRLKDSTGKGTMYFRVADGYALCKIVGVVSK